MPTLPDSYPFAEEVPKGGSSCANCQYLGKDEESCTNTLYIQAHGGPELGAKKKRWCCIAWTPEGGR